MPSVSIGAPQLWPRRLAQGLIRLYQLTVSAFVGRQCRYLPSCSDYAGEAIGRHGLWPGGWMALARLCRCHPLGGSGYDPVAPACPRVAWSRPWDYGAWRCPVAACRPSQERANNSAASP